MKLLSAWSHLWAKYKEFRFTYCSFVTCLDILSAFSASLTLRRYSLASPQDDLLDLHVAKQADVLHRSRLVPLPSGRQHWQRTELFGCWVFVLWGSSLQLGRDTSWSNTTDYEKQDKIRIKGFETLTISQSTLLQTLLHKASGSYSCISIFLKKPFCCLHAIKASEGNGNERKQKFTNCKSNQWRNPSKKESIQNWKGTSLIKTFFFSFPIIHKENV